MAPPLIQRLDHIIFCARDRHAWAKDIERVLALTRGRGRDTDDWGFANWEFDIGDGFLGLVSPAGENSLLDRFLDARGDSYYAISVQVASIAEVAANFEANGIAFRPALRDGEAVLLWPKPVGTGGILFQVIEGMACERGANTNLLGLRSVIVASPDRGAAVRAMQAAFRLGPPREGHDDRLAADVSVFAIADSALGNEIVIAEPTGAGPLKDHVDRYGASVFAWTLAVTDLDRETARLAALGLDCETDASGTAWLPADALPMMRLGWRER